MTSFIYGTEINLALEELIDSAEKFLWFVSPYIKLHDRIKAHLKKRREDHKLKIVIVFGKNERDVEKSISSSDIDFLKEFPNITICYEKNLHAKYYANENFSIITSMNLLEYSQNTNVEVAIVMDAKSKLFKLFNLKDAGADAMFYFEEIIDQSEVYFKKMPTYKSEKFGLIKNYLVSEIEVDRLNEFFNLYTSSKMGYCIRTGQSIPLDISRPFSYEAYQVWAQFENPDYPETYCHLTGKLSGGKTSMRNPIL